MPESKILKGRPLLCPKCDLNVGVLGQIVGYVKDRLVFICSCGTLVGTDGKEVVEQSLREKVAI